ncbi:DUF3800 domain-containing protein [Halomonas sp. LS-001]
MQRLIYLDESGDLGWKFDAPFGQGGSSKHLTIASAFTSLETNKYLCRTVKDIKKRAKWPPKEELKWVDMPRSLRTEFCERAANICHKHPSIEYQSLILAKEGVFERLRHDDAMLYNYLIKVLLLEPLCRHRQVTLIPDPRGISPNAGHPLHIYLQGAIFERKVAGQSTTELGVRQADSKSELGIQFADMLAGAIQLHYEGVSSEYYEILRPYINSYEFFFPSTRTAKRQNTQTLRI